MGRMLNVDRENAPVKILDKDGKLIRASHNLNAILKHSSQRYMGLLLARADKLAKGRGELNIFWTNGDTCSTDFESFEVLCKWLRSRKSWKDCRQIEDGELF